MTVPRLRGAVAAAAALALALVASGTPPTFCRTREAVRLTHLLGPSADAPVALAKPRPLRPGRAG